MTISIKRHSENIFWFDLSPNKELEFISIYLVVDDKIALIETGPACSLDNLVSGIKSTGLKLEDIDYVVPTHIHLDHFGGGGHIMELCKNAKALVHPKAYKHVSNIEKWWQGSSDFLGKVAQLYGKPKPIPDDRLISAEDGFEVSLGGFSLKAVHTPGHAPHHITWIYGDEAFVGDSAGLWYPEIGSSFPVTPGYYRHDLALKSIKKMESLNLKNIFYTHFGPRLVYNTFEETKKEFELWMDIVEEGYNRQLSSKEILRMLFNKRPGLLQTNQNHGIHQKDTHKSTVEGMIGWLRRKNEKY
ncbi:MAG: MBL fold metallo-hydrolase [Candidatus Thermoplasmatota archaeon]|nr:MBL fold metallo-hydrolase [Candidatus Thermoplasmatota archaeon]